MLERFIEHILLLFIMPEGEGVNIFTYQLPSVLIVETLLCHEFLSLSELQSSTTSKKASGKEMQIRTTESWRHEIGRLKSLRYRRPNLMSCHNPSHSRNLVVFLSPFWRWGHWGLEVLSNLAVAKQQVRNRACCKVSSLTPEPTILRHYSLVSSKRYCLKR